MFKSVNKLKDRVDKLFDTSDFELEQKDDTKTGNSKDSKYSLRNSKDRDYRVNEKRKRSIRSIDLANLKSYLFLNGVLTYLEDWPDRLDDTEVESEGSSVTTDQEEEYRNKIPS